MSEAYHLQDVQTLELEADTETIEVAGVRGVTITGSWEIDELFTADSGKVEALKQREFTVDVEIENALFDGEVVKEWLGGDGSSSTSVADNSDPATFTLTGEVDSTNAADTMEITVEQIVFPDLDLWDMDSEDFMERGLSGTGYDISNFDVVSE